MKITKNRKGLVVVFIMLIVITLLAIYPLPPQAPIHYYDRKSGVLKTEKVAAEKWLIWLYNNPVGEATLNLLGKRKLLSSIYGKMMDRSASKEKIQPFIDEFNINMSLVQQHEFDSFNDFFTRKLKDDARPVDTIITNAVSPADGKVLAYNDINNSDFIIKGYRFDISSFLNNDELAQKYSDASMLVVRLAPSDYHRFHFPISGRVSSINSIDGDYYSVSPLALRKKMELFCLNKREISLIVTSLFGEVLMVEVGATMVGSIVQTFEGNFVYKGEEKGYFRFGGSTVVLLFKKDKIRLDDDLLNNTLAGYETAIKQGESIGVSLIVP